MKISVNFLTAFSCGVVFVAILLPLLSLIRVQPRESNQNETVKSIEPLYLIEYLVHENTETCFIVFTEPGAGNNFSVSGVNCQMVPAGSYYPISGNGFEVKKGEDDK